MSSNDLYGEIQQGTSAVVDLAGDEGKIRKFVPMKVPTFLTWPLIVQKKCWAHGFLYFVCTIKSSVPYTVECVP